MDNRPIGLFDSGVGGLTVFKDLYNILPRENYLYFGDTKNLPYGTKSKDELIFLAKKIFDFFQLKDVKAVVMACNTTSATAFDALKGEYDFEIYPIIQAASASIARDFDGKIAIAATEATVKSAKYRDELMKYNPNLTVAQHACKNWVNIVENSLYGTSSSLEILRDDLRVLLSDDCKNVVLGCTHYPYLTEALKNISGDNINFINPADYFVEYIKNDLQKRNMLANEQSFEPQFYVSSSPSEFVKAARIFYPLDKSPSLVDL